MTEQTQPSLAEQLIALGTAANRRLVDELKAKSVNESRYKIVKSLAKFLTIGTQIKSSPLDHKFDDLIGVLTATQTHESDHPFEPDYSVPALKKVAARLQLDIGESMEAKVSVLSEDSICDSLEEELFITESKLTDDSRPDLQDLMQLAHPSEVEWCPDDVKSDSSLHSVVTELWWLVIDDKAKCSCQRAANEPHHLQTPLLSLCPCQDESGNFTFDILFKTACTLTSAESSLSCVHESFVTIKSEPLKQPVSNGLSIGKLCEELKNTHGKSLPLCIHNDTDSIYPATMTAGAPEDDMKFGPAQIAFSLDDDTRFEKMDTFDKVQLAADLSSSFYHFYGTRWMSCPWRCRQLQKFETPESLAGEGGVHTSLLLSYHHDNEPNQKDWVLAPEEHRRLLGRCWPQLFTFGLILLELMCNSTTRRKSRDILDKSSLWERYCAARELRMTVEKDLHPLVNDILDSVFENRLFQDAVDDDGLERRRYIISAKVTATMKKLQHLCTIKAQQHKRPALSINGIETPRPKLLFRGFIDRIIKPRCLKEASKSVGWVERFVNINEKVIRNLHTVEPAALGVELDTRWMPSRPIRIAILDSGYDPNSQFFKDQEAFGNSGIKDRITWKDFIGDNPPEDKHEERHGTKLLCLMLMLLPMAEIFVGRVALNKTYTESTKFVGPLVEAIDFATKIWGVDVVTISLGVDVNSESISEGAIKRLEGAIKRACQYRDDRILFFAASGNEGRGEDERYPAHYSDHVIGVRGTYANGTINSAYDPNVRSGSGEADPRFATLATEVPYGELTADRKKALQVSGTSIAAPILAATAVTFLQFASFAAWYKPHVEKHLRVLFERKGMVALFRKIGRHVTTDKRVFISPWMLFNVQNWEDWESLPQEMLSSWIQTMCDATKTV